MTAAIGFKFEPPEALTGKAKMESGASKPNLFQDFREGKFQIYVIISNYFISNFPIIRKIDERRFSIISWISREKAEECRKRYDSASSPIVSVYYDDLLKMINLLPDDARNRFVLEINDASAEQSEIEV